MNALSHNGESHPFSTIAELEALPMVTVYTADPEVTLAYNPKQLWAAKLIGKTPVWHLIGDFAQPVHLPKALRGPALQAGEEVQFEGSAK